MVHWTNFLPLLGGIFSSVVVAAEISAQVVPGAYIVELEDNHDSASFYSTLGNTDVSVKHRMKLDYTLFKGTSFQLKNVSDVDAAAKRIANMAMVKQMWPVRVFKVPTVDVIWKGSDKGMAESALQKRQSANTSDTFSTHVMTQVDKLRAEGVTGQGVKIAVIDTGVDYNHPALGGCFGSGCLVSYGTDLVGDNYDGFNTPVPDPDPHDSCEGHGTHVSGIIAAQANPFGFTGAAPGVTLGAYRVFGCGGSAGNDVLIAAYNEAYEDGSDIITASIGGASGWTEDPWAVAVQRIVEAGVPCTVSAGNDGAEGIFYASTAANGKKVTAIASVDNTQSPMVLLNASYATSNSSTENFGWTEGSPNTWENVSLPLWAVNYNVNDTANGCDPYPDSTPDLSGYIVLIRRGSCTFVQKATNAAAKGAKYILFYNNVPGLISVSAAVTGIQGVGMVTAEQGAEWITLLAGGATVTVNIIDPASSPKYVTSEVNTASGGFLSTYTSWGPTWEVDVKPQLAAPGGLILSTYPLALGGYAVISGTSMACPLTAAVYALVAKVRGTFDPATIENLLSATSNPNLFHDGATAYPYLAPVAQQGSGLIQAYDAAHATTLLSVSSLSFNDTDHFIETTNFTIRNLGSEEVTYSLSNVVAATAYTLDPASIHPSVFPNELVPGSASLAFSEDKVTVPAGGLVAVTVSPTAPAGLEASRLPVYSGYIALNGTNGDSLSLPYLGVKGSLHDATVLDADFTYLTKSTDNDLNPVPANQTFTIPATNGTAPNGTVYPAFVISLALGSSLIRADVVPQNPLANATTVLGARTLGNVFGFPARYMPRGGWATEWDGTLEDGSYAPAGTYTLLIRALKIFGDASVKEEYETTSTVPFTIRYQ
ncbi:subtilase [Lentithecium fluviatile CBS 122367]|uniref:Subtilase n=1 Tax=Lentithecium fluviatile CBS 122367 TaxID=1168545 RepID=A0A6G1JHW2_9PLEO|nr:subtilase [Lentithecium fluviatile CBS 122367]